MHVVTACVRAVRVCACVCVCVHVYVVCVFAVDVSLFYALEWCAVLCSDDTIWKGEGGEDYSWAALGNPMIVFILRGLQGLYGLVGGPLPAIRRKTGLSF